MSAYVMRDIRAYVAIAISDLNKLELDKARLDWLDKQFEEFEAWSEVWVRESKSADLRKVIDEMREAT